METDFSELTAAITQVIELVWWRNSGYRMSSVDEEL